MIVVIVGKQGPESVDRLVETVGSQGVLNNVVERRDGRRVVSFHGPESLLEVLTELEFVEDALALDGHWGLIARQRHDAPARVPVGSIAFGDGGFAVMAGPCSVESLEHVTRTAEAVRGSGAVVLRGGAFKPRTSPYGFQGLGDAGLGHLSAARRRTGLPVVTEVMAPEDVELVAAHADMLQIGSRNIQNFRLLEAVGVVDKPVLLKRGMMSTIDEFLAAAEYVFMRGNENIVLCERGIRSFEPRMRNTLDLGSVALMKRLTHLPVVVDPSHGSGLSELVPDLARASLAVGADGLLVEVHPTPELAMTDGRQSLALDEFDAMMRSLEPLAAACDRALTRLPDHEARSVGA